MDEFATLLAEQRRVTLDRLEALTRDFARVVDASIADNADDEHDPEGATIAFERSQLDALVHQARDQLSEIAAAQARIATKSYGQCEACGSPIAADRLRARPSARTCIDCATRSR